MDFNVIPPLLCYVMEEKLLRNNPALIKSVKERAGVNIILHLKHLLYGNLFRSFVSIYLFDGQFEV